MMVKGFLGAAICVLALSSVAQARASEGARLVNEIPVPVTVMTGPGGRTLAKFGGSPGEAKILPSGTHDVYAEMHVDKLISCYGRVPAQGTTAIKLVGGRRCEFAMLDAGFESTIYNKTTHPGKVTTYDKYRHVLRSGIPFPAHSSQTLAAGTYLVTADLDLGEYCEPEYLNPNPKCYRDDCKTSVDLQPQVQRWVIHRATHYGGCRFERG